MCGVVSSVAISECYLAMGRSAGFVIAMAVAVLAACSPRACGSTVSADHVLLLQQYVLEGLGLTRVPDTANMNISDVEYATKYESYLRAVSENRRLRQQRDTNTQTFTTALRFRSYAHLAEMPYVRYYNGSDQMLYFPVGPSNATVEQATLRLFAVGPLQQERHRHRQHDVTLRVYQVRDGSGPRALLDTRVLRLHGLTRWVEMDVAPAVDSWLTGQSRNLGLEVECAGCHGEEVRLLGRCGEVDSFCPVLNLLLTEREPVPRSPRTMGGEAARYDDTLGPDCRNGPNRGRCCRHSMEVVFKDVPGFEFILQPYKFNAGFCKGRCPPRYHPASQHALLQSLVWKKYRVPRPCCAPHVLADVEVLHLDETDPSVLKVSTWKGMQVQRCACS